MARPEVVGQGLTFPGSKTGTQLIRQRRVKATVRVVSTTNVAIATLGDGDTHDGVTVNQNDRIFLQGQTLGEENGVYDVGPAGGPSVRSADFDEDVEVVAGVEIRVAEGTVNADTNWILITDDPIVVGTTVLVFQQDPPPSHTHVRADITDFPHAADHDENAVDEILVEDLGTAEPSTTKSLMSDGSGGLVFGAPLPGVHAASHADGAADEVPVDGLAEAAAPGNDVSQALRPDGTGGVAFSDVAHADLISIGTDDHHSKLHAADHSDTGADEITVENLGTAEPSTTKALMSDGAGGLLFGAPAPDAHAASHADGGADEVPVAGLAEAAAPGNDISQALRPDGAGGVSFSDVTHADLTGVGVNDHHSKTHRAEHISGGADAFIATDLLEAIIKRIQTTDGPTVLLVGAIADGEFLKRSGTAIVSAASSAMLPVPDTTSIVEGSADATKEVRLEVDGLTTATVRVLTVLDKDYTIGDFLRDGSLSMQGALVMGSNNISGIVDALPDSDQARSLGSGTLAWLNLYVRSIRAVGTDLEFFNSFGDLIFKLTDTESVFNEEGDDRDFRFEGSGDANLLTTDGGLDRVGVGMAPNTQLAKFHVNGAILGQRDVEANTAVSASPNIITTLESGRLFTNEGVAAKNFHTLPSAAKDLSYTFYVQDAFGMRIVANTGDTIRLTNQVSKTAGFVESLNVGALVKLTAINATEWIAEDVVSAWDVETS